MVSKYRSPIIGTRLLRKGAIARAGAGKAQDKLDHLAGKARKGRELEKEGQEQQRQGGMRRACPKEPTERTPEGKARTI